MTSLPPGIPAVNAEIHRLCDGKPPEEQLAICEDGIQDCLQNINTTSINLCIWRDRVVTAGLFRVRYPTSEQWVASIDGLAPALQVSQEHFDLLSHHASRLHNAWQQWPWELFPEALHPRIWSRGIMEGLRKLADGNYQAEEVRQAVVASIESRSSRSYVVAVSKKGQSRDRRLTPGDTKTALETLSSRHVEAPRASAEIPALAEASRLTNGDSLLDARQSTPSPHAASPRTPGPFHSSRKRCKRTTDIPNGSRAYLDSNVTYNRKKRRRKLLKTEVDPLAVASLSHMSIEIGRSEKLLGVDHDTLTTGPASELDFDDGISAGSIITESDMHSTRDEPLLDLPSEVDHGWSLDSYSAKRSPAADGLGDVVLEVPCFTLTGLVDRRLASDNNMSNEQLADIANGGMLVGEAVVQSLRMIRCPDHVYVVDPLELQNFEGSKAQAASSEVSQRRLTRLSGVTKVILPYHDQSHLHWSLFEADWVAPRWTLRHYDSSHQTPEEGKAIKTIRRFLVWLLPDFAEDGLMKCTAMECASQKGLDCGVHVIVNAAAIIQGLPIPKAVDGDALRRELFDLLAPHRRSEKADTERRFSTGRRLSDIPNFTDDFDSIALFRFCEDRFEKARNDERRLRILRTKQNEVAELFKRRREERERTLQALLPIEQSITDLNTSIRIYQSMLPEPAPNIPVRDSEADQIVENSRRQMETCLGRMAVKRGDCRQQVSTLVKSSKITARAMAGTAIQRYVLDLHVVAFEKELATWKRETHAAIKKKRDHFAEISAALLDLAEEDLL
ncbi:MAG: hypothetical protein Q9188_006118 [Gyalolechia gomerana]